MTEIAIAETFHVPADDVWSIIRRFDHPKIADWLFESCEATGDDVGSMRTLRVTEGIELRQELLHRDDAQRELHVKTVDAVGVPMKDLVARIRVTPDSDPSRCVLHWSIDFSANDEQSRAPRLSQEYALVIMRALHKELNDHPPVS